MAKGGGPSKKTIEKEKKKTIEDKTFGLKNKNKSKVVQKQVQQVKNAVNQIHDKKAKKEAEEKEKKRMQKLLEKQREAELKSLFKSVDDKKKPEEEENQEEDDEEDEQDMFDQIEEELKNEEDMTIEEVVEVERSKIVGGTPVTFESFKKWKEFKNMQKVKEEEIKKKQQMESFKKSGAGLSGRDLFEYNQSLFVDDEEGDETVYVKPEDIDESLFVEEEEEQPESQDQGAPEEYDPATWKDPNKTPKTMLTDYQSTVLKLKPVDHAKFEQVSNTADGFVVKCVLTNLNKEFVTQIPYRQKKTAEHNAALMAYNHLMSLEKK
ncbi:hypothetical protein AKO1_013059 [Acrasis kona]|uniref:ZC3H15/TMA46 family C-terminal domain-containing protein n=2 Tax=Acrasis kona TaxID=1008807 RepID=A0AAW2YY91_9EUKA